MAVSACGAPVGGSARESNTARTKGTPRAAGCRHKRVDAMLGTNVSECGQFGQGADRIVEIWGTKPGEFHTDACRIGEDCTIDLCDSSRLSVVRDTALSPPTLRARMGLSRVPGWMPRRAAGRKRPHRRAMGALLACASFCERFEAGAQDFDVDFSTDHGSAGFREPDFRLKQFMFQAGEFVDAAGGALWPSRPNRLVQLGGI